MAKPNNVICYFARHGVTGLNRDNCFRGNKDVPLAPEGIQDAHKLADMFEKIPISHIICSDRIRASKTAEIIASKQAQPIHKSENLRALNVGDWSGLERNKENTDSLQVYLDNPDEVIPGGESLNQFKARIDPCLNEAIQLGLEEGVPPLVVAHSSIIHELGSVIFNDHHSILVDPGGVVAVYVSDGKIQAKPIFKKAAVQPTGRADTVS